MQLHVEITANSRLQSLPSARHGWSSSFLSTSTMRRRQLYLLSNRQKRRILQNFDGHGVTSSAVELSRSLSSDNHVEVVTNSTTVSPIPSLNPSFDFENTEQISSDEEISESEESDEFHIISHTECDIKLKLQKWNIDHKITLSATSDLLKILKSHDCFSHLPSDARTLLHTPKTTTLRDVPPGKYCHFGVEVGLRKIISNKHSSLDNISVQFNVDGLPIAKSNGNGFWPIIGCLKGSSELFVVGIYEGRGKPDDVNDYLKEFVDETLQLCNNGIIVNNKTVQFGIEGFVCDAPARAYITGIKHFSGFYGCGKCVTKGKTVQDRVVFVKVDAELRTNASFRGRLQPGHHVGNSDLEKLPIDMIKCMPYEYMHLICLGVTKKLLKLWCMGKGPLPPRLAARISKKLVKLGKCLPVEFNRKQRGFKEIDRWKATEFRTCLLYTGIVAFKKHLPKSHYEVFMCLSVAIRYLCSPKPTREEINYAEQLLQYFVETFKTIYGRVRLSYNVHGLIHVAEDVRNFGPLDNYSAFKFENKLGQIKRLIRKSSYCLSQVHRRLEEKDALKSEDEFPNQSYPVLSNIQNDGSYKSAKFETHILKSDLINGVVLLRDKQIALITKFSADRLSFVCRKFVSVENSFSFPCDSALLRIFKVETDNLGIATKLPFTEIISKCVALPESKSNLVVLPLLHCS